MILVFGARALGARGVHLSQAIAPLDDLNLQPGAYKSSPVAPPARTSALPIGGNDRVLELLEGNGADEVIWAPAHPAHLLQGRERVPARVARGLVATLNRYPKP